MFAAMKSYSFTKLFLLQCIACTGLCLLCAAQPCGAQEADATESAGPVADEARTIIINPSRTKPLAFLYAASSRAVVRVGMKEIEQSINLKIRIVQGERNHEETFSLGLGGMGDVIDVKGETIASWAVRTTGTSRFLDLQLRKADDNNLLSDKPSSDDKLKNESTELVATIIIRSRHTTFRPCESQQDRKAARNTPNALHIWHGIHLCGLFLIVDRRNFTTVTRAYCSPNEKINGVADEAY